MDTNIFIEFEGEKTLDKDLINMAKEVWKNEGKFVKDLKKVELYYKPAEHMCYYVFNGKMNGSFSVS